MPLRDGYTAPNVGDAVAAALGRQPAGLVRSLTWDQGRELACWADIEAAPGIKVCFCDPHSPWQRGSNEQANGSLRCAAGCPKAHRSTSAADIYTQLTRNHQ